MLDALFSICALKFVMCNFSTFMNALGVKLNDYRDVMSNSQMSAASERLINVQSYAF